MTFLLALPKEAKVILYDEFVKRIETQNKKEGKIYGSIQIIDMLESDAVKYGYIKCPYCGSNHKK